MDSKKNDNPLTETGKAEEKKKNKNSIQAPNRCLIYTFTSLFCLNILTEKHVWEVSAAPIER